jgi:hypothetical protein
MIITRMALPRRTFLRGLGATLALPFLDAMVPAFSMRASAAGRPSRMGFVYVSNGMYLPNFHPAGGGGSAFELTPILRPLEAFQKQMTVVTGLSNLEADTKFEGGGPHTRGHTAWLNGTRPNRSEGADLRAATTIDQHAAAALGKDTQLLSLELALEPSYSGNCDNGYSCTYVNTFSWRTPTMPLPMENNPRVVFERLFGDGGKPAERVAEMRRDRSILDAVTGDMSRLQSKLGPNDRRMVGEYLEAVRDVERRIQKAEEQVDGSPLPIDQPLGVPSSFDEHAKLMFDMQLLAMQADITRVFSLQLSREQSGRAYPWIGVSEAHHGVSHHNNAPEKIALKTKIDVYHMELFARFLEKMRATPDGDGNLLDRSIMVYGSGMSDGNQHSIHNLPLVLIGGGNGQLKGGRHLNYPLDTPMMNFGLSLLDKVGVELKQLGDSTGRLTDL